MKPLLSTAKARDLDVRASRLGDPDWLMTRASDGMFEAVRELAPDARSVLALCGTGANGGDAAGVALRFAQHSELPVTVVALEGPRVPGLERRLEAIGLSGGRVLSWPSSPECVMAIEGADVVLDGLSGIGLRGPWRDSGLLALVAGSRNARVYAVDVPTGVRDGMASGDPALAARATLAVEPRKLCLYAPRARSLAGKIVPIRDVFPRQAVLPVADAQLVDASDFSAFASRCPSAAHKGSRGKVAVFAGGEGSAGAARIAARACFRAGLVRVFAPESCHAALSASLGGAMAERGNARFAPSEFDAALVGPGFRGEAGEAESFRLAIASGLPCALDSGALDLAAREGSWPDAGVLTPHPGEFSRITGLPVGEALADPRESAERLAARSGCVVVLKSHVTWIVAPDGGIFVYDGMVPELATGGSGDALAGIVAGYLASGASPLDAALAGVIAHGEAGRAAAASEGYFDAEAIPRFAAVFAAREESDGRGR